MKQKTNKGKRLDWYGTCGKYHLPELNLLPTVVMSVFGALVRLFVLCVVHLKTLDMLFFPLASKGTYTDTTNTVRGTKCLKLTLPMNNLVDICILLHSEMGDRKKRER